MDSPMLFSVFQYSRFGRRTDKHRVTVWMSKVDIAWRTVNAVKMSISAIGIYRLKNITGETISDTALEYIGRPFDWQFDMEEDNSLYCSELLYVILKKIDTNIVLHKIWLKEIGKNIIPIDVCSQSEYFIEVGYW